MSGQHHEKIPVRQHCRINNDSTGSIHCLGGKTAESLVKVGGETISDPEFYARIFTLVQTYRDCRSRRSKARRAHNKRGHPILSIFPPKTQVSLPTAIYIKTLVTVHRVKQADQPVYQTAVGTPHRFIAARA